MNPAGSPRAVLVAVGDELLRGEVTDTNSTVVGERLSGLGIALVGVDVVPDEVDEIAAAVGSGLVRAEVVLVCGGLGPTHDDLTREGVARAAGVLLRRDPALQAALEGELAQRYAGAGRAAVPAINWRQADLPAGALPLHNPAGTAPGLWLAVGDRLVAALPGVPHELTAMLDDDGPRALLPRLAARFPDRPAVARCTVRTVGLWESRVATLLAPEIARTAGNPRVAFLAAGGEVRVVLSATAPDQSSARQLAQDSADRAREVLGDAVVEGADLATWVVTELTTRGQSVGCAESLTAGLLAGRLAGVPGASAVLRGGIVAYATELKAALLGVPAQTLAEQGAVSASTALAMAAGARRVCGADFGVALTGVAGPDPQEGHPPGKVFAAVAGPAGDRVTELTLPGDRQQVRTLAVTAALALLREVLTGRGTADSAGCPRR